MSDDDYNEVTIKREGHNDVQLALGALIMTLERKLLYYSVLVG